MSKENVEFIRKVYRSLAQGESADVIAALDPNIEWFGAQNNPNSVRIPLRGVNEVIENVFVPLASQWDGFVIRIDDLLDAGDKVVMLGNYLGTYKATAKSICAQVVHVWTLSSGKVVKWQQYVDTYQLHQAIRPPLQ